MGGILALGVMASEDGYTPLWTPNQMMDLFTEHGSTIFPRSQSVTKVWDPSEDLTSLCYPSNYFEKVLKSQFRQLRFSDVLVPTLVTASRVYRKASKIKSEIHTFESTEAQRNEYYDYLMRDVARAASAATGAFLPTFLKNVVGKNEQAFLDAGTKQNNPARLVHDNIISLYTQTPHPANQNNTFIISIGTRVTDQCLASNPRIINMVESTSEEVDKRMEKLLGHRALGGRSFEGNYYRLQPRLEQAINITDACDETFEALETAAEALNGQIEGLARILAENKDRKHPASL